MTAGSLAGGGTGVYICTLSGWPRLLAARSNCAERSRGARSLAVGTVIRVLAGLPGSRAP